MPRVPIQPVASRPSYVSAHNYAVEGRRHLRQAMTALPDLDPIVALVSFQEQLTGILRPRTINRYKRDLRRILQILLRRQGRQVEFDAHFDRIGVALEMRRGRPAEKRTSARKVKDATYQEGEGVFFELKRQALATGNMTAVAAAIFPLVAVHTGIRPIEVVGSILVGTTLHVRNAKDTEPTQTYRIVDLSSLPPTLIEAVRILLLLAPLDPTYKSYKAWSNAVRQSLGRGCERIGIRLLSLYSFRHVALASWERAGFSAAEIAALAGHKSLATARTHYARKVVGWQLKNQVRPGMSVPSDTPSTTPIMSAIENSSRMQDERQASAEAPGQRQTSPPPRRAHNAGRSAGGRLSDSAASFCRANI